MKEVLTKRFWQDLKKTFDEAKEDSPAKSNDSEAPDETQPNDETRAKEVSSSGERGAG
jgi:hypothetical protein